MVLDAARVMSEKFAGVCRMVVSEFLDPNHTSKLMILVSLMIPTFARNTLALSIGELQNRDTSVAASLIARRRQ